MNTNEKVWAFLRFAEINCNALMRVEYVGIMQFRQLLPYLLEERPAKGLEVELLPKESMPEELKARIHFMELININSKNITKAYDIYLKSFMR